MVRLYEKAKKIIKSFTTGDKVGYMTLRKHICKEIGSDERTIEKTLRTMLDTDLIKDIGYMHFEVL